VLMRLLSVVHERDKGGPMCTEAGRALVLLG